MATDILGRNADKLESGYVAVGGRAVAGGECPRRNVRSIITPWRLCAGFHWRRHHFAELQQVDRIDADSFALSGYKNAVGYCWYNAVHAVWGKLSCVSHGGVFA